MWYSVCVWLLICDLLCDKCKTVDLIGILGNQHAAPSWLLSCNKHPPPCAHRCKQMLPSPGYNFSTTLTFGEFHLPKNILQQWLLPNTGYIVPAINSNSIHSTKHQPGSKYIDLHLGRSRLWTCRPNHPNWKSRSQHKKKNSPPNKKRRSKTSLKGLLDASPEAANCCLRVVHRHGAQGPEICRPRWLWRGDTPNLSQSSGVGFWKLSNQEATPSFWFPCQLNFQKKKKTKTNLCL